MSIKDYVPTMGSNWQAALDCQDAEIGPSKRLSLVHFLLSGPLCDSGSAASICTGIPRIPMERLAKGEEEFGAVVWLLA